MARPNSPQMKPNSAQALSYADGDVVIILSTHRQYSLHCTTLRLNSTYFRDMLADECHSSTKTASRLELVFAPPPSHGTGTDLNDCGGFFPRLNSGSGCTKNGGTRHLTTSGLAPIGEDLYKQYENVFRSFYQLPLILSEPAGINSILQDAQDLVLLAEALGAIGCVGASLENWLIRQGQTLFRSISNNPGDWGDIGIRTQSELITREAVCHLVGRWNSVQIRKAVEHCADERLMRLVWRKWEDLNRMRVAAEMRIMGFYPRTMLLEDSMRRGGTRMRGSGNPTRLGSHSKNMVDWMAINLFRHWMGQHMCAGMTRFSDDGGYAFYNSISRAGETYIDQESRVAFAVKFPLSEKGRTNFDAAVIRIKEGVKRYVKDLVQITCRLDVQNFPVRWLTCTQVNAEEMPWREQHTTLSTDPSLQEAGSSFSSLRTTVPECMSASLPRNPLAGATFNFNVEEDYVGPVESVYADRALKSARNENAEDVMRSSIDDEYGEGLSDGLEESLEDDRRAEMEEL